MLTTPTQEMRDQLSAAILVAWRVNADFLYPENATNPDVSRMAEVAGAVSASMVCEWLDDSRSVS